MKIAPVILSRHVNKLIFSFSLRSKLKKILSSDGYNVVHYHGIIPAACTLDKLANDSVATIETWGDPYLGSSRLISKPADIPKLARGRQVAVQSLSVRAQIRVIERIDKIISVSNYLRSRLVEVFGIERSKVEVVPPGVDVDFFKPGLPTLFLRTRYSVKENSRIILCPARITPLKRQEDLITAVSSLKRQGRSTRVFFVGAIQDSAYVARLYSLCRRLDVSSEVTFTGIVPERDFPHYYNLADIVVLPSLGEGFASALVEAMSCGRPVLASDAPSNVEAAVSGKEATFYPRKNAKVLAEKLCYLLDDVQRLKDMSEEGRRTATSLYSWDRIANETIAVYNKALAGI